MGRGSSQGSPTVAARNSEIAKREQRWRQVIKKAEGQEYYAPEEVLDHIRQLHSENDEGWWEGVERQIYRHRGWKLIEIQLDDIPLLDSHPSYPDRVDELSQLETEAPEIVVSEDGDIIDGVHRAKAAKKQGKGIIQAFVPDEL